MKSAIYSGLFSSDSLSTPSPPFSCPTGNCTWEPFSTLTLDTHCVDVSSSISLNCTDEHYNRETSQSCTFTSTTDPGWLQNYNATEFMVVSSGWLDQGINASSLLTSVVWVKALNGIAHFPYSLENNCLPYIVPGTTFEAVNCSLFFSVKELRASVYNGVYSEKVLRVDSNAVASTSNQGIYFNPQFSIANSKNVSNSIFTVGEIPLVSLTSQFVNMFNGYTSASPSGVGGTSLIIEMMWLAPNLTQSIQNMAVYATNALRSNDSVVLDQSEKNSSLLAPNQAVLGTVWVQHQIVIVRWPWLAFPTALVVGVATFLLATVVMASRSVPGIWKSSPLALLFHVNGNNGGEILSGDIQQFTPVNTVGAMENTASKIRIKVSGIGSDSQVQIFTDLA